MESWLLKYRPKTLAEMVLNVNTRKQLESVMKSKQRHNLLLYGNNGLGKNTFVDILISNGKGNSDDPRTANGEALLDMNSTRVNVDSVRNDIMRFCSIGSGTVLINEAEKLSKDAEIVFRDVIEKFPWIRFVFTMNKMDKKKQPVIDAGIKSRCIPILFKGAFQADIERFCKRILAAEGIKYNGGELLELVKQKQPDMRAVVDALQLAYS